MSKHRYSDYSDEELTEEEFIEKMESRSNDLTSRYNRRKLAKVNNYIRGIPRVVVRKDRQRTRLLEARNFVEKWKSEHPCLVCEEKETVCLDFHHLDATKKDLSVSEAVSRGWKIHRIKKEIKKCVIICSNCHRKVHAKLLDISKLV